MSENPDPSKPATAEDQIRTVLERARSGDQASLPSLRKTLDDHPEIWEQYGALTTHAHRSWIELIGGTDLALKESLTRRLKAMRVQLTNPDSSPLETLLIERILACWLQSSYADTAAARPHGLSLQQLKFATKRQEAAHRAYLSAIASLAMTRKLLGGSNIPAEKIQAPRSTGPSMMGEPADNEAVIRLDTRAKLQSLLERRRASSTTESLDR